MEICLLRWRRFFAEQDWFDVVQIARIITGSVQLGVSHEWDDLIKRAKKMEEVARISYNKPPKHLLIFLNRTRDHEEDVRRMRELLMLLSSVDGHDRFTFYVPNPQGVVQLDFPHHTTSYEHLQDALNELIGEWGTLEVQ